MPVRRRDQRIRERAYYLAQQEGFPPGRELDFWLQAKNAEPFWSFPSRFRAWLTTQKDALSTIQAVVTIVALGVGGLWTWWLFDPTAQRTPNLYVTQMAETRPLADGLLLLHVNFLLENTGKVTAFLTCAAVIVSEVRPANPDQVAGYRKGAAEWDNAEVPAWPVMKWMVNENLGKNHFFVEVGNKAQVTADFIIPDRLVPNAERIRTIRIYSNFQRRISDASDCRRKPEPDGGILGPGWETVTLYEIPSAE
jgi:Protein of unknown function (DUF2934)